MFLQDPFLYFCSCPALNVLAIIGHPIDSAEGGTCGAEVGLSVLCPSLR